MPPASTKLVGDDVRPPVVFCLFAEIYVYCPCVYLAVQSHLKRIAKSAMNRKALRFTCISLAFTAYPLRPLRYKLRKKYRQ
jgi:hypothetical protein